MNTKNGCTLDTAPLDRDTLELVAVWGNDARVHRTEAARVYTDTGPSNIHSFATSKVHLSLCTNTIASDVSLNFQQWMFVCRKSKRTPVREAHKNATTTATTNEINCWPAIQIVQTFWTLPKARIFIIINLFSFCIIWNAHFYAITCSANAMSANFLRIDVWFLDAYITEFESIFIFTISVFALAKELLWLREIDEWIIMRRKSMRR